MIFAPPPGINCFKNTPGYLGLSACSASSTRISSSMTLTQVKVDKFGSDLAKKLMALLLWQSLDPKIGGRASVIIYGVSGVWLVWQDTACWGFDNSFSMTASFLSGLILCDFSKQRFFFHDLISDLWFLTRCSLAFSCFLLISMTSLFRQITADFEFCKLL